MGNNCGCSKASSNFQSYNAANHANNTFSAGGKYAVPQPLFTVTNGNALKVVQQDLASNLTGTNFTTDVNLNVSIGIVVINNVIYVANVKSNTVTTYDLVGNKLPTTISVNAPTGIVQNTTPGFIISDGVASYPASLLIASLNGTVYAYNQLLSPNVQVVIDNSANGAEYTGITILGNYLYLADFANGIIDVYDSSFNQVNTFLFADPTIPAGFNPFNIQRIGLYLYVTYASAPGTGNGYINIFNSEGILITRFVSGGVLNQPWGIIAAPTSLCLPSGSILVANHGDGFIYAYNSYGLFYGTVTDCSGNPLILTNIYGLALNPNANTYSGSPIYFTTGINLSTGLTGLVGELIVSCAC